MRADLIATHWEYRIRKSALKLRARIGAAAQRAAASFGAKGDPATARYVTSRYGVLLRANWHDRTFQYCYYGTYGTALSDLLDAIDQPFTFIDIGANQGLYSLIAAKKVHCEQVIALEPVRDTFRILQGNIAANGQDAKITAVEAALSNHTGTARISTNPEHSGTASLDHRATGQDAAGTTEVQLIDHVALDAMIMTASGSGSSALVIKVDVEGHESVVIHELMKSRHAATIVHLFYEIDKRWTSNAALIALLEQAGFSRFRKFGVGRHFDMLASR